MLVDVIDKRTGDSRVCIKLANGGREVFIEERDYYPDYTFSLGGNTAVKLVELARNIRNYQYYLEDYYLILQRVDEEQQVYERIGIMSVDIRENRPSQPALWHFEHHSKEMVLKIV